jgi:hypothetical protein
MDNSNWQVCVEYFLSLYPASSDSIYLSLYIVLENNEPCHFDILAQDIYLFELIFMFFRMYSAPYLSITTRAFGIAQAIKNKTTTNPAQCQKSQKKNSQRYFIISIATLLSVF